jgi:hypothetical protein
MATLPSGLPDLVGNEEALTRFLTSSSLFSSVMIKPAAFLPNPKFRNTSVFREITGGREIEETWAKLPNNERSLHGVAILTEHDVRECDLEVTPEEPPDRHANIVNWPWDSNDPELLKARHKSLANAMARRATLKRV